MDRQPRSKRLALHPWFSVPRRPNAGREPPDVVWFLLHQRVSIHIAREEHAETVIVLHYPPPKPVYDGLARPARTRVETMGTPSRWQSSSATSTVGKLRPSSYLDQHLSSLLERCLPGALNGSETAVEQIFTALMYSLVPTTALLRQRIAELGDLSIFRSAQEKDIQHGDHLLRIGKTAQQYQSWVRDAVELLEHVPRRGQTTSQASPTSPLSGVTVLGADSNNKYRRGLPLPQSEYSPGWPQPSNPSTAAEANLDAEWRRLKIQFRKMLETVESLTEQALQLSQTRLVYMQIAESRKAIDQANSVRRLTTLAFIFIPLTYVATIFSANIAEMDGNRNAKNFAISSLATTVGAILAALYMEQCLWPIVKRQLNAWRQYVYTALVAVDFRDKTSSVLESILLWRTYLWGPWNLSDRPSNWALLPLATLDLGRLRLRMLFRRRLRQKHKDEEGGEEGA